MSKEFSMKKTFAQTKSIKYTKQEIIAKIENVPFWGHSIPLPHGVVTPGKVMDNFRTLKRIQLPDDLSAKRVLDIGAWDGFYSFECEKRGAQVLAIDNFNRMQRPDEIQYAHLGNLGFETVKDILESEVEFRNMDVYDINPTAIGKFDIVLFLGVLYHLKHPALALEKISEVVNGRLIIETEWMRTPLINRPLLEYIEGDSVNQDPTNFCRPNTDWIKFVFRDLGFNNIRVLYRTPIGLRTLVRSILKLSFITCGRIIVEAWKSTRA